MQGQSRAQAEVQTRGHEKNCNSTWWGRSGTVLVSYTKAYTGNVIEDLLSALKRDSRVTKATGQSYTDVFPFAGIYYPSAGDDDELLVGADHFHSCTFDSFVVFQVHVPLKNQPEVSGQPPQSTDFWAAWNGISLTAIWRKTPPENVAPIAAGQIAIEVLRAATREIGLDIHVQACSSSCDLLFSHVDFDISQGDGRFLEISATTIEDGEVNSVTVTVPKGLSDEDVALGLASEIDIVASEFASLKNRGIRAIDINESLIDKTNQLIQLEYRSISRLHGGKLRRFTRSLSRLWQFTTGRGFGRRSRRLISEMWLEMSALETLKSGVNQSLRDYLEASSSIGIENIFGIDLKRDISDVSEIDYSFAKSAIENRSARMDNKAVMIVTLGGAMIGSSGLGALLGSFLTKLF